MKRDLRKIFSPISKDYELVNHILTLSLDHLWRRKAARIASRSGGNLWLDVCTGTGEMACYLSRNSKGSASIVGVDFSPVMIKEARRKRGGCFSLLVVADAGELPFKDESFDLVTISFGMRNLEEDKKGLLSSLKEFHRVLRVGGRLVILETSQPELMFIRKIFHFFVRVTVVPLGVILTGSKQSYSYLSYSIRNFPPAPELKKLFIDAGFNKVEIYPLFFGVAAIHKAIK